MSTHVDKEIYHDATRDGKQITGNRNPSLAVHAGKERLGLEISVE
jgi:hypothetical protein